MCLLALALTTIISSTSQQSSSEMSESEWPLLKCEEEGAHLLIPQEDLIKMAN